MLLNLFYFIISISNIISKFINIFFYSYNIFIYILLYINYIYSSIKQKYQIYIIENIENIKMG